MQRIAVAIIHGLEISDPDFAATPSQLLKEAFAEALGPDGPDPDDALAVQPVHWAPELEQRERSLFARMYPEDTGTAFEDQLAELVRRIDSGSVRSLAPFVLSLLRPTLPGLTSLHYPTARWLMVHFVGDAIAYDRRSNPEGYNRAHLALARALAALARKAGPRAPLCVLSHSFGSILISDYVYDRQESVRGQRPRLVPPEVRQAAGAAPLARGETLAWLYTMGSPMALWSLRYPDAELDRPITVPGADVGRCHPDLSTEWVNLYSKDDLISYPLRALGPEYEQMVTEDRAVSPIGLPCELPIRLPVPGTPLGHPFYWTNRSIMEPIAHTLAKGWAQLNRVRRPE
jgi:hypothetical protein